MRRKVQIAERAFKSKDLEQLEIMDSSLAEAAEMSAHAFDKTIMLLIALIQGATCTYLAEYSQA